MGSKDGQISVTTPGVPEISNDSSSEKSYIRAPHGLRFLAWLIDGVIVIGIFLFLPQPSYLVVLFVLLIAYHTILTWLARQTIGKALARLEVERIGKDPGFFWALGRSSIGYFVVDMFAIGIAAAMFNRHHRCLHDYVFGSFVIHRRASDPEQNDLLSRLVRFAERQAKAVKEKKKPVAILAAFWAFLAGVGKGIREAFDLLINLVTGTSAPAAVPSIAEVLSLKMIALIGGATAVVSGTVVTQVPIVRDTAVWLSRPHYFFADHPSGVFDIDAQTLARFELDRDVLDDSGSEKHARLLGGEFVTTPMGRGLHVINSERVGLDWNDHANRLVHPFTIEMILTPQSSAPWGKLFSFDDKSDSGWYYKHEGIQAYPHAVLGASKVKGKQRHYLAFVSTGPRSMDVYFQGEWLGSTKTNFDSPPTQAIFFRDDSATNRREQIEAVVEEIRISAIARTPEEMANVEEKLRAKYRTRAN